MKYSLFILTMSLILIGCSSSDDEPTNLVPSGSNVPSFTATDVLEEKTFNSKDIDKATLIYFLWSECPECREQTPVVIEIANQYTALNVICIARGGENATYDMAVSYWGKVAVSVQPLLMPPLYFDAHRAIYNKFARSGVPRIYLVNAQGVVEAAYETIQRYDNPDFIHSIEKILAAK